MLNKSLNVLRMSHIKPTLPLFHIKPTLVKITQEDNFYHVDMMTRKFNEITRKRLLLCRDHDKIRSRTQENKTKNYNVWPLKASVHLLFMYKYLYMRVFHF